MGRHETVNDELPKTEKHNVSCAINDEKGIYSGKPNEDCIAETVISMPKELPISPEASNKEERETRVVVDLKYGDEEKDDDQVWEGEIVCRICHLDLEELEETKDYPTSSTSKPDLIQLGCGCKGELSLAHSCCAETWFKIKGNMKCEICGQIVSNVKGAENEEFIEEWMEGRENEEDDPTSSSPTNRRCWHAQPFCNFILACIVLAFILPWFFRVNFFKRQ